MNNLFKDYYSGAKFSHCGKYRYVLWRIWDESKPKVMFIGLNPSTANENTNDPTINRVIGMGKKWGYGGVYMLNLFTVISANPEILLTAEDPARDADWFLKVFASCCEDIIFAWGAFPEAADRAKEVIAMFPNAKALIINKDGSPRHPLYVPSNTVPVIFNPRQFFSGKNE